MGLALSRVGIVGGTGRMGAWFARLLERCGLEVLCAGRRTPLSPREMARQCDVVVISVPIAHTISVIREIGPLVPKQSLLMDLTSLKKGPVEAMLRYSRSQVVGLHPLFGPDVGLHSNSLRVVVCPGRGEKGLEWIEGILQDNGFKLILLEPEAHDRVMGLIQGMNHFSILALAICIGGSGYKMGDLTNCSTRSFKQCLDRIRAIVDQPAELFGSLMADNPHAVGFINEYLKSAHDLMGIIREGDKGAIEEVFESLKGFFLKEAM